MGLVTSTGNEPTPDPDDNVDGDDNGDTVAGAGVLAAAVTLTIGGEPTTDGDGDPQTNLTVDFGFTPISDLVVIKSDDPDPVVAGESLTYTLQVTNQGPSPVTGVVVTDTLPAGVAFTNLTTTQGSGSHQAGTVTIELGSLASGGSATITIVVAVLPSTTGPLLNQAVVTGDNFDPVLLNNSDDEPTQVIKRIDLSIDKTDTPDPVIAGQRLNYTLLVTNLGPSDATGVTVEDTLPAGVTYVSATSSQGTVTASGGTLTATLGDLDVGAQATITIAVDVAASARGTLVNTASVSGNETETNLENNEDQVSTQINTLIDLAIDKTGSPDPVTPGQRLTYTLTVTNAGPSDATGVQVVDTLPSGVVFVSATSSQGTVSGSGSTVTAALGNLADGGQATVTILADVAAAASGTLVNAATVSGSEPETNLNNNTDQVSTTIQPRIDLAIIKADSPDPVFAGGQLTYTLSVVNNGPSSATGVTVVDTLPTGITYQSATTTQGTVSQSGNTVTASVGPLAGGATATVTILVTVDPATLGTITNVATVTGNETETNTANNQDDEPTQVQAQIDLTIAKTDSADPVTAGGQLTYTLVVTNNGPSSATGVVVTDTLPAALTFVSGSSTSGTVSHASQVVTAAVGNLASGQTATITLVTQVDQQFSGTITNTATVTGNETESNTNNNTASQPTVIDAMLSSIAGSVYVGLRRFGQRRPERHRRGADQRRGHRPVRHGRPGRRGPVTGDDRRRRGLQFRESASRDVQAHPAAARQLPGRQGHRRQPVGQHDRERRVLQHPTAGRHRGRRLPVRRTHGHVFQTAIPVVAAIDRSSLAARAESDQAPAAANRVAKAACSGVDRPSSRTWSVAAKSPRSRAAGSSHRPGKVTLRTTPRSSAANGS